MAKRVIAIEGNGTDGVEQGLVPGEVTTDDAAGGTTLDFEMETPAVLFSEPRLARLITLEAQTEAQNLTVALIHDNTTTVVSTAVSTAAGQKARVELPIARVGSIMSVRIASTTALTKRIEIASVELDVADPAG
jgi:hypothetical protein